MRDPLGKIVQKVHRNLGSRMGHGMMQHSIGLSQHTWKLIFRTTVEIIICKIK